MNHTSTPPLVEDPPTNSPGLVLYADNIPTTPQLDPTLETDDEMTIEQEIVYQIGPGNLPPRNPDGVIPPTRLATRASRPTSYANALKRTADQARNETSEDEADNNERPDYENPEEVEETASLWPNKAVSGPIKGFTTERVLENLDHLIRGEWEKQSGEGIFIHHLDGGYHPYIAQTVHTVEEDLMKLYTEVYKGTEEVKPIVEQPTAATPTLHNRHAAPFLFLVTGLPEDYRRWLVTTGVHEVSSHLGLLFVENGAPIPHDYTVSLTNYNMRTETEVLRSDAHHRVRQSVIDLLFDIPSDTSRRTRDFINLYHDNLEDSLTSEQAHLLVRDSVKVTSLDITIPNTRITAPVYNVYIHPPTAIPNLLERWRKWVQCQKYYAGKSGVGVKYPHTWRCLHCKTIDHPSGLCTFAMKLKEKKGKRTEVPTEAEDILPLLPVQGPSRQTQNPNHSKRNDTKGKRVETKAPPRSQKPEAPPKGKAVRTTSSKKRKVN